MPRWISFREPARGWLRAFTAFGPVFSNQVWSTVWLARFCPKARLIIGVVRWRTSGKYANKFEKWWENKLGVVFTCLEVCFAS